MLVYICFLFAFSHYNCHIFVFNFEIYTLMRFSGREWKAHEQIRMKSVIAAKFHKNVSFWRDLNFRVDILEIRGFRDVMESFRCNYSALFTICPCGNQVDGSPHVVSDISGVADMFLSKWSICLCSFSDSAVLFRRIC